MQDIRYFCDKVNKYNKVEFNALEFSSVHFGQYWQKINDKYPEYFDLPPLGEFSIICGLPTLRRVWFKSPSTNQLIQLQSDRFFTIGAVNFY